MDRWGHFHLVEGLERFQFLSGAEGVQLKFTVYY